MKLEPRQFFYSIALLLVTYTGYLGSLDAKEPQRIVRWEEMAHNVPYDFAHLKNQYEIQINEGVSAIQRAQMGQYYLFCEKSGCVVRVYHSKGLYSVLLFPDEGLTDASHTFIEIGALDLKREGIDLDLIDQILRQPAMSPAPRIGVKLTAMIRGEDKGVREKTKVSEKTKVP